MLEETYPKKNAFKENGIDRSNHEMSPFYGLAIQNNVGDNSQLRLMERNWCQTASSTSFLFLLLFKGRVASAVAAIL